MTFMTRFAWYGAKYFIILNKVPGPTAAECTNEDVWIAGLERIVGAQYHRDVFHATVTYSSVGMSSSFQLDSQTILSQLN